MKCEYREGWPSQHQDVCGQEATRTIKAEYPGFMARLALCGQHADHIMRLDIPDVEDISNTPEARHK